MGDDQTVEQAAKTEALFPEVNERIAESAAGFDADTPEFICECVAATLDEYEEVRADGATFLLTPGHEQAGIEQVVDVRGRFEIVEQVQRTARAIVLRLNPRTAKT